MAKVEDEFVSFDQPQMWDFSFIPHYESFLLLFVFSRNPPVLLVLIFSLVHQLTPTPGASESFQVLIFKFPARPAGDVEDEDFIPLLAEHSLADVARDTSREWKEAIVVLWQKSAATLGFLQDSTVKHVKHVNIHPSMV